VSPAVDGVCLLTAPRDPNDASACAPPEEMQRCVECGCFLADCRCGELLDEAIYEQTGRHPADG
jgi:hypothetical protein